MMRKLRVSPAVALAALLASAAVAGWSLRRALITDPVLSSGAIAPVLDTVAAGPRVSLASSRLAEAVGKDPFHPERRRPAHRFRLPGEGVPAGPDSTTAKAPFKLIGIAVMPEGRGFAMCQLGQDPPKLVRIGEKVADLTLKSVKPGRAVFLTASGQRYEVLVPKAGS